MGLYLIEDFFHAITREDIAALARTLSADAQYVTDVGQQGTRAIEFWTRRFARLGYADLSGRLVYNPNYIRSYSGQELSELDRKVGAHLPIKNNELLLVVPIIETTNGKERRFGDTLEFAVALGNGGYKIRAIYEDFRLP